MEAYCLNIKILPMVIRKNGFTYILVTRGLKKAIYRQTLNNVQVGYEVFIIRVRGAHFSPLLNKVLEASERFPSNEDFGRTAWIIVDYQNALKRFMEL